MKHEMKKQVIIYSTFSGTNSTSGGLTNDEVYNSMENNGIDDNSNDMNEISTPEFPAISVFANSKMEDFKFKSKPSETNPNVTFRRPAEMTATGILY